MHKKMEKVTLKVTTELPLTQDQHFEEDWVTKS